MNQTRQSSWYTARTSRKSHSHRARCRRWKFLNRLEHRRFRSWAQSTMNRTSQDSPSIMVSPPDEGAVMADVDSLKSIDISAQSQAEPVNSEDMDVTSAPLISALIPVEPPVLRIYISCVLHPFFNHKLDSGPVRLMTVAHAFNYCVASTFCYSHRSVP